MKYLFYKYIIAMLIVALSVPFSVYAGGVNYSDIVFNAYRNHKPFGEHSLTFSQQGNRTIVDIKIKLGVKLAFITFYKYEHTNQEVWENGKLVHLESNTNDNGKKFHVFAERADDGIHVTPADGHSYIVPEDTLTTSYWQKKTMKADRLINTQTGETIDVHVTNLGVEEYQNGRAERFRVEGDLVTDILYDTATDQWVSLSFKARGSKITYEIKGS